MSWMWSQWQGLGQKRHRPRLCSGMWHQTEKYEPGLGLMAEPKRRDQRWVHRSPVEQGVIEWPEQWKANKHRMEELRTEMRQPKASCRCSWGKWWDQILLELSLHPLSPWLPGCLESSFLGPQFSVSPEPMNLPHTGSLSLWQYGWLYSLP